MQVKKCGRCKQEKDLSLFPLAHKGKYISSWCRECHHARYKEWRVENAESLRERMKRYRSDPANKERKRVLERLWRKANPEKQEQYAIRHAEARREAAKRNAKRNLERRAACQRLREASRRMAQPKWADRVAIICIYSEARRLTAQTGILHHVDHIIPLKHALVCGLHVHQNLRVVAASENAKKRNKFAVIEEQNRG